jgi:hypothetical protein
LQEIYNGQTLYRSFSATYYYLTNIFQLDEHGFYIEIKDASMLIADEKCTLCKGPIVQKYIAMKGWDISGPLCSACYSKKIGEHYPGAHTRVNVDKK